MTSTLIATPKVATEGRIIDLLAVPYNELSFLAGNPNGERVQFGAFAGSCQNPRKVFLMVGHDQRSAVGRCIALWEEPDGLHGSFQVRDGQLGDQVLADARDGWLPACSVGFRPVTVGRGRDGETIVLEGELMEVSLLPFGAYTNAKVLAVRRPTDQPAAWPTNRAMPTRSPARQSGGLRVPTGGRGKLGTIRLF